MHPHQRLTAWQKAHEFTVAVLRAGDHRPRTGHVIVVNRLRFAAISLTAHIVEGSGQKGAGQFAASLGIAIALARECGYLICLASDVGAIDSTHRATLEARCEQVSRLLVSLKRHLDGVVESRSPGARALRKRPRRVHGA